MDQTPNLRLPYLVPGQAQKHVTMNEALAKLDAVVQLRAVSDSLVAQPDPTAEGAVYILPEAATGPAWGAMDAGSLAWFHDGYWAQINPQPGWMVWVVDADCFKLYTEEGWSRSAVRESFALGSAAAEATGTSGHVLPFLDGNNVWSGDQSFSNYQNFSFVSGNSAGVLTGRYNIDGLAADHFLLSCNYDAATGVVGSPFLGTAMIEARATNSGQGSVGFWTGGQNSAPVRRALIDSDGIKPAADNLYSLGTADRRFRDAFVLNGISTTSDLREKTGLREIADAEMRAVSTILTDVRLFSWKSGVAEKGETGARLHAGPAAQAVDAAFRAEGLDTSAYGFFLGGISAAGEDEPGALGLRPIELLWLAVHTLAARLDAVEHGGSVPRSV